MIPSSPTPAQREAQAELLEGIADTMLTYEGIAPAEVVVTPERMAALRAGASALRAPQGETTVDGGTSDGYHTFNELYDYRRAYNAALFNTWSFLGYHGVHKSWNHSDGQPAFGGGWFIVVAQLPTGQISNHYKAEFWDVFQVEARELPDTYDGHTPQIALERLNQFLLPPVSGVVTEEDQQTEE